jgi:hypothetical protein
MTNTTKTFRIDPITVLFFISMAPVILTAPVWAPVMAAGHLWNKLTK